MKSIRVSEKIIGNGSPCFVIAEAGVNHNGDIKTAKELVDVAVQAGADAVKFQTFRAEDLVTKEAPKAAYQRVTTDPSESQFEMLKKLELTEAMHETLKPYCEERGILFLSTPFDEACADYLDSFGLPLFKIPSGEITNIPFLEHVAKKGKPMMVSTGMSHLEEVRAAVKTVRKAGNSDLILLHCVSRYPTPPEEVNLKAMETMRREWDLPVGFSDHTKGIEIALAAAALGADVIEKHYTLDRTLPGPDHQASLEPGELKGMISGIRNVEKSLGDGKKTCRAGEKEVARVARKSLVAGQTILKGSVIQREWIQAKRPGTGLSPSLLSEIVGLRTTQDIPEGTLLTLEMFQI